MPFKNQNNSLLASFHHCWHAPDDKSLTHKIEQDYLRVQGSHLFSEISKHLLVLVFFIHSDTILTFPIKAFLRFVSSSHVS